MCSVELLKPIEVRDNTATYEFHGVGSEITSFFCKLDGVELLNCMLLQSPNLALTV